MNLYRIPLLFALVSVAGHAFAMSDYICKIDKVVLGPSSEARTVDMLNERYRGKEFTVSRRTGVMSGALKNAYITSPVIVDSGSKDNSFLAVTTLRPGQGMGPGSYVYLLVIREFHEGKDKPFMFADNDQVHYGTCRSF